MSRNEMNARVATEVMGWEMHLGFWMVPRIPDEDPLEWHGLSSKHFNPMTENSDAWLVVEKMRELGWSIHLDDIGFHNDIEGEWRVRFILYNDDGDEEPHAYGDGDTVMVAICNAALAALSQGDAL